MEMRRRGHDEELIRTIVYDNPIAFLNQSAHFRLPRQRTGLAAAV
jgi:uncharacterized protein